MITYLSRSLRQECIEIGVKPDTKQNILRKIASLAKKSPVLESHTEEEIFAALEARERLGSTGFMQGAAIPHCSFTDISEFVVGILTVPEGTDFESVDNSLTKVVFFIIGPQELRNEHISLLSTISKIIKTPGAFRSLLIAKDPASLRSTVLSIIQEKEEKMSTKERCMFHVFIQKEEYFNDILEILSSASHGSISVIEARNAGHYLHNLPLFSQYSSGQSGDFHRIIMAVVDRTICNDTIRRINIISEDIDQTAGVLMTVQDIFYTNGLIEF